MGSEEKRARCELSDVYSLHENSLDCARRRVAERPTGEQWDHDAAHEAMMTIAGADVKSI